MYSHTHARPTPPAHISATPPWYHRPRTPSPSIPILAIPLARAHPSTASLGDALVLIKAHAEILAMLVARMVRQHLAARGALECLEAGFALDGLGGGVLGRVSVCAEMKRIGRAGDGGDRVADVQL